MGNLIINNYVISAPIIDILNKAKSYITTGKLAMIEDKGEYVRVTCPNHKDGMETRPSCSVYDGDDIQKGHAHCFTCQFNAPLYVFLAKAMDISQDAAKEWLITNFGDVQLENRFKDLKFTFDRKKEKVNTEINESVLNTFESYHPYMTKRKISDDTIKKYELKYDPATKCIVFPVRNKNGKLVYLTRRSVDTKKFIIDPGIKKEVYLLYDVLKNNYKEVYITESQINALVCNSYGKQAVAMFGCGCPDYQINDLNNTGVKKYIIALDPDLAGLNGTLKLCNKLSKLKFVDVMILPKGKDIGDLTKEEFENCKTMDRHEFIKNIPEYYKQ